VYSRGRQIHCIARHSSKSVSASFASRNVSPEAVALSSSGESKEEGMGSDPKTPTASKVTTGRLSSKTVLFLKLPAAFHASILKEKAFNLSWDD